MKINIGKAVKNGQLKKEFLFLLLQCLLSSFLFAQSYYSGQAPDAPGSYRKTDHSVPLSGIDKTMTIRMMDAMVDAVKKTYPIPLGAEIAPYGGIWKEYKGTSEFKDGPYVVHLTIPFFELLNVRTGGIEANGEYSSSMEIWVNSVKFILQGNPVQYGNDLVFRTPVQGIAVNGFPKYNNMVLILPPGKSVPWRPATKQEYLENFIEGLKISLPGRSSTPAERDNVVKAGQLLASMSPAEKKQIAYLKKWKYANAEKGYSDFGSFKWAGFLDASDTTGQQLIIIDEKFYDKNLPRTSLQLIVIDRRYPPASYSATAPSQEQKKNTARISERMNSIVRAKEFLSDLQLLLGKNGWDYVAKNKKERPPEKTVVIKKPVIRNLDRIVDSLMRNFKVILPAVPGGMTTTKESLPGPLPSLPPRNTKKLSLASRRLNTKEEVVQYLDELDKKISGVLSGTTIIPVNDANAATKASYGYWIFQRPRESLLMAIKAAKLEPENNTTLNNLGATLSLCGGDYLAVPLYIVCLKKEPANSTITNNLGQSYLALGDHQQAELYLKKAIAASPRHHHANNSLGFLYRMQGKTDMAIQCYENSLRNSFTLEGFNGLKALKKESALKLMNYIRHRYKQPDYINFDKYQSPRQCITYDQTKIRIAEHKYYQKTIDDQIKKYTTLKDKQKPLAAKSNVEYFSGKRKQTIRPFLPFATAVLVSVRKEYEEKILKLQLELVELERSRLKLKVEFDATVKQIEESFEPRLDALGEGNADPTLDEEMCSAMNSAINSYLPKFAEINEERYKKIIHTHKNFLNDYLYWVRFASFTDEQYRVEYYDVVLTMLHVLREVKLTTLHGYCDADPEGKPSNDTLTISDPDCPLPIGVEIPFGVGKIQFDCKTWGLEVGEVIVFDIEHTMGGATTIAIGPGHVFFSTPKFGGDAPMDINPGINGTIKGQVFVTFDANTVLDWGILFEAEIDVKGLGKPLELKQNVTLAVNKGFTVQGQLTDMIDKYYEIPPEKQENKNVNIYKPRQ